MTPPSMPTRHAAAAGVSALPTSASTRSPLVLRVLFVALVLYAALGKGFAYAGYPPVFVGEVLLVLVVLSAARPWAAIPRNAAAVVTGLLVAFAVVQFAVDSFAATAPLLETVRGLAPVYYCAYAFAAYALLRAYEERAGRAVVQESLDSALVAALPWILGATAVLAALLLVEEPAGLPVWPGSEVSVLWSKSGDIAVSLVLFAPVVWSSRTVQRWGRSHRLVLACLWCGAALLVAFRSRGALVALIAGLVVARPHAVRLLKGTMAIVTVLLLLYVTGLSVEVSDREISYDAISDAVAAVLGTAPEEEIGGNYVGNTTWRTDFWTAISDDVQRDRMVLHGHGWGDNLAVRYGFVSARDADDPQVLRLPHSIFFTLLGRAGVIVAVLFVLVPLLTIASTFRAGATRPIPLTTVAARGAVAAAFVNGLADPYLESPQGGILFWSLIGLLWWATAPHIDRGADEALSHVRAAP